PFADHEVDAAHGTPAGDDHQVRTGVLPVGQRVVAHARVPARERNGELAGEHRGEAGYAGEHLGDVVELGAGAAARDRHDRGRETALVRAGGGELPVHHGAVDGGQVDR